MFLNEIGNSFIIFKLLALSSIICSKLNERSNRFICFILRFGALSLIKYDTLEVSDVCDIVIFESGSPLNLKVVALDEESELLICVIISLNSSNMTSFVFINFDEKDFDKSKVFMNC